MIKVFLLPQLFKQNRRINFACFTDSQEPFHTFNSHFLECKFIFSVSKPIRVSIRNVLNNDVRQKYVLSPVLFVTCISYSTITVYALYIGKVVMLWYFLLRYYLCWFTPCVHVSMFYLANTAVIYFSKQPHRLSTLHNKAA